MQNQAQTTLDDLIPYKSVPEKYPHLYTPGSWQWAVIQRQHNGLARAFRKIGKNLFVNTKVLAVCIDEQLAD